jgi:hypothetical protein
MPVTPVDSPSFLWRQHAAEGIALAQTAPLFAFIQKNGAYLFPRFDEDTSPLSDRWRWIGAKPARARFASLLQARSLGIAVNPGHDRAGQRQTAFLDITMRLHQQQHNAAACRKTRATGFGQAV